MGKCKIPEKIPEYLEFTDGYQEMFTTAVI